MKKNKKKPIFDKIGFFSFICFNYGFILTKNCNKINSEIIFYSILIIYCLQMNIWRRFCSIYLIAAGIISGIGSPAFCICLFKSSAILSRAAR